MRSREMSPRTRAILQILGDFAAERSGIPTKAQLDAMIDAALGKIRCRVCGEMGLERVARVLGEPDYVPGKERAVCVTCGAAQWKSCEACKGDTAPGPGECPDCGGSGLRGAAPDGTEQP